ncbi:MAG: transposase, partial [Sulfuricurvum sp.]|nr:transposase [Sulfuricurvum sp.]
ILMPSLNKYKHQFLADNLEDLYYKEFSKFMRTSKIIKVSERYNTITRFWNFFESFIIPYKGVSNEFFPYYLKEAEFKFNFSYTVREKILTTLYFHPSNWTDI